MPRSDSLRAVEDFSSHLIPRLNSAAFDLTGGHGRVSPVHRLTLSTCHVPYAGAVPDASPDLHLDCCLRPQLPGSARSVPHGFTLSTRQTSLYAAACGLAPFQDLTLRFDTGVSPDAGSLLPGPLAVTRAGLPPAGHATLHLGTPIGAAHDLWTAYRKGAFGKEAPKPFVGWFILVEDTPKSRSPVKNRSPEPVAQTPIGL